MALTWQRFEAGPVTCANWRKWLGSGRPVDPYLVWADASGFAGFGGFDASGNAGTHRGKLPLLIQFTRPPLFAGTGASPAMAHLQVPGVYKLPLGNQVTRFLTARAPPAAVEMLLSSPEDIERFQLGLPRIPDTDFTVPLPPLDTDPESPRVVIGVVDDGCAFAHLQFRDRRLSTAERPVSRVHAIWDQDSRHAGKADADATVNIGYGRVITADAIQSALVGATLNGFLDENAAYGAVDYRQVQWRSATHGTGVLDLAAGRTPSFATPLADRDNSGRPLPQVSSFASADRAGQAPIIFVQLPTRTVMDTSGGSLGVHLLDGLRYVINRAERLADAKVHVVTTVSFGSIAGPHDGTSMIEQAMSELVTQRGRLALVVAAGNAHGSATHAALALKAAREALPQAEDGLPPPRAVPELDAAASHEITWRLPPDNPQESYLEIWLPAGAERGVLVKVQPPGAASPHWLHPGHDWTLHDPGIAAAAVPVAGAVYACRVAQGTHGTMVLVAVGPTRPHDPQARAPDLLPPFADAPAAGLNSVPRAAAPAGDWRVEVFNRLQSPIEVHIWTERNDLVGHRRRRQQARLLDDSGRAVQSDSSLASLANGAPVNMGGMPCSPVIVASGYRLSDGKIAPYASGGPALGPSPRLGPDVEAPSDHGVATPGLRVAGTRSGLWARLGGTSAAAPLVARWIANRTARWSNIIELSQLLARELPVPVPDQLAVTPPWPDRLPQGFDDAPRRGRRRLE